MAPVSHPWPHHLGEKGKPSLCSVCLIQINPLLIPSLSRAKLLILPGVTTDEHAPLGLPGQLGVGGRGWGRAKQVFPGNRDVAIGRLAPGRGTQSKAAPELFSPA